MIRVAVADRREVQPGNALALQNGEIRVVRQPPVDLDPERCAARVRRVPGPRPDEPPVAGPGFEEHRRAGRSDRLEVDIRLQPARDLAIRHQRGGAHQAGFLAIGDENHQRPVAIGASGQHARGLERHAHAERVIGGARPGRHRVVVRDERDRFGSSSGPHRDDVGDARREPDRGPPGIGLLHAHVETEEPQLVDDVRRGLWRWRVCRSGGCRSSRRACRCGRGRSAPRRVPAAANTRREAVTTSEARSRLSLTVGSRIWPKGTPAFCVYPPSARRTVRQAHPAGVNRHPDHGIHADRIQELHLIHRRDAACGRQPPGRGVADRFDRAHVRALHQAFAIDVRVEELSGVGFERAHRLGWRHLEHRSPTVDDDVSVRGCRPRR